MGGRNIEERGRRGKQEGKNRMEDKYKGKGRERMKRISLILKDNFRILHPRPDFPTLLCQSD